MATVLHKYPISSAFSQTIQVRAGSQFPSVELRAGQAYLAALEDDTQPLVNIEVISLAQEDQNAENITNDTEFVGIYQQGSGANSVTHVFVRR